MKTKIFYLLILLSLFAGPLYSASTKVGDLPAVGGAPSGTDEMYIIDGGVSKKVTVANLGAAIDTDTNTQLSQEQVEDFSGTMVGNGTGTHTRVTITYQDATGDMDVVVDDMNDDVPEAGDFGNATDLDANGALNANSVSESELLESMNFASTGDWDFSGGGIEIENGITPPGCTEGQLFMDTDATSGQRLMACEGTAFVVQGDGGGGGGGDSVSIDGGAVVDPDFVSTGDIDFIDTSNTITANINAGSIIEPDLSADVAAVDGDYLQYDSTGTNFTWRSATEVLSDISAEGTLTNEAGLYAALSDVTNFLQTGDTLAGDDITDGSVDASEIDEAVDYSFSILSGKQDRNNTAVNDDDCTGEQGSWWYDTTDSAFEFCNANSGVPAVLGGGGGGATDTTQRFPIQLKNPQVSSLAGNSYFTVTALTAYDLGHWEFLKDVDGIVTGTVNIPNSLCATPAAKIILQVLANATTGVTSLDVSTAAIADGESINPASLTAETIQDITVPGTAYLRKEVSFTLTNVPVAKDTLIVEVLHDGNKTEDTLAVNTLIESAQLEICVSN